MDRTLFLSFLIMGIGLNFISTQPSLGFAGSTSAPMELKGYATGNNLLVLRIMKPGSTFGLSKYLGEAASNSSPSLTDLMGSYDGADLDKKFRNGIPNVINMTLWFLALDAFSNDLAQMCDPTLAPKSSAAELAGDLDSGFLNNLKALCQWPQPKTQTDQTLAAFWLSLVGYDAPVTEYFAWKKFFLESQYINASAKETIAAMAFAALYNPYFLLNN